MNLKNKIYTVRYEASGTQVDKTVQTRDSNRNFNAVSIETEKSDEVPADKYKKSLDRPKWQYVRRENYSMVCPLSNVHYVHYVHHVHYVHGRLVGIGESTSLCGSFQFSASLGIPCAPAIQA